MKEAANSPFRNNQKLPKNKNLVCSYHSNCPRPSNLHNETLPPKSKGKINICYRDLQIIPILLRCRKGDKEADIITFNTIVESSNNSKVITTD